MTDTTIAGLFCDQLSDPIGKPATDFPTRFEEASVCRGIKAMD
jgi:hypothetical protein